MFVARSSDKILRRAFFKDTGLMAKDLKNFGEPFFQGFRSNSQGTADQEIGQSVGSQCLRQGIQTKILGEPF